MGEILKKAAFSSDFGRELSGPRLDGYFNSAAFAQASNVASYKLVKLLSRKDIEGVKLRSPATLVEQARALMTDEPGAPFDLQRFSDILDLYIETGIKVNSRGYMARQFSSVVPVSAVFDMVSAMAPQPATYYEAGQLANVADKIMAEEFGRLIGWPEGAFEMVTTSGASLANLTAALVARNLKLADAWRTGVGGEGLRPAIAIGDDAHYSVSRIAGILGVGQDQVVHLPLDDRRRICPAAAAAALDDAAARGLRVFCIIASAGSTSVGANDPLEELAALARRHDAWLHVDAAHNGAFLVSDQLRSRLKGLELADSFCLDAHKTLFVPGLCTLLFYREKGMAETAFPQKASYVMDPFEDEMSRFQSGIKNFECTKRPSIVNLWLVWALHGRSVFEEKLNYLIYITEIAFNYVNSQDDFEVMHRPESNILCFRYRPPGVEGEALSALQLKLRDRIREDGRYFVSKVELDGETMLRLVMMNHQITPQDIADLCDEIRCRARDLVWRDLDPALPSDIHPPLSVAS